MIRPTPVEPIDLWERDGSLRDVYVLNTTLDDWAVFLEVAAQYGYRYSHDGQDQPLPTPEIIFAGHDRARVLHLKVGRATVNCHFFVPSEIELDLDPREILEDADHFAILQFLETLSLATKKKLLLTAENCPDIRYLSYDPATEDWQIFQPPAQCK